MLMQVKVSGVHSNKLKEYSVALPTADIGPYTTAWSVVTGTKNWCNYHFIPFTVLLIG